MTVSGESSARRIQPTMATCSFADYRPEMGKPIRISLGRPKYRTLIESDDRLWALTPRSDYFHAAPEEFDRRYVAQLDRVGVERLREQFEAFDDGQPLILLCFERNGADCHRRLFSQWWLEQTGEHVPELHADETVTDFPPPQR